MPGKLDIGKIVFGAFIVPWRNRYAFVRTLWIPLLALTAVSLLWGHLDEPFRGRVVWALYAVYWLLFVLFAVTCHRLVLLDAAAVSFRSLPSWSWRETRFALLLGAVGVICIVVMLGTVTFFMNVPGMATASRNGLEWIKYLAVIPAYYVFARMSLVLPATAVDRKVDLKWAWRSTKTNGWRLVLVVGVLPWVVSEAIGLIYRSEPTVFETLIVSLLTYTLMVVEIAALSLSYRQLTENDAA